MLFENQICYTPLKMCIYKKIVLLYHL